MGIRIFFYRLLRRFRRAPVLFHEDDRQLAALRLEQSVADYRTFRARNS